MRPDPAFVKTTALKIERTKLLTVTNAALNRMAMQTARRYLFCAGNSLTCMTPVYL